MRPVPAPRRHLFVCVNRREGSPLGPGCADRGDELYEALKAEVARRGEVVTTWVTRTHCLGVCPTDGATVARWQDGRFTVLTEVAAADVPALLEEGAAPDEPDLPALAREIDALEELQQSKVLALARRLKPGLTLEDVQNPHDFPELDDPDWHYADGVLTGIQSVKSALLALRRRGPLQRDGGG